MATTYQLMHWVVKKNPGKGTARVHLHGERRKGFGGIEKHIDIIEIALAPDETDAELVRCAAAISSHKWKVGFGTNVSKFNGHFSYALDDRLATTLPTGSVVSSHTDA